MSEFFTVYDSKGEPFEVRPAVAKNLVVSHGFSMEPPKEPVAPTVEHQSDEPIAPIEPESHATSA